ncbi:MAG: class I SAM-dependent methyltransferase [Alphaproteobacteria bacterium]|nr:class I SAM-dependent methyltransferase [Alphaproteobacteria bacterium]
MSNERNGCPVEQVFSDWDRIHRTFANHSAEALQLLVQVETDSPLRILDLACGTGGHLIAAAGAGHIGLGIDVNPAKIASATQRAEASGWKHLQFRCYDMRLGVEESDFDVVLCLYAMSTVSNDDDFLSILRGAYRALRAGGHLFFNVANKGPNQDPRSPLFAAIYRMGHMRSYTLPKLQALLHETGFEVVTTTLLPLSGLADLDILLHARSRDSS